MQRSAERSLVLEATVSQRRRGVLDGGGGVQLCRKRLPQATVGVAISRVLISSGSGSICGQSECDDESIMINE